MCMKVIYTRLGIVVEEEKHVSKQDFLTQQMRIDLNY